MDNDKPLMVTIRCITYNQEPYIRDCLEGFVMQQTDFRFEAIVHDDASTDGTAAIIKEYAEKYPDIIKPILETENQYSKHDGSLNRIMNEHTHGKYVAYCEGDDYWTDPLKLQMQVDYMEAHHECSLCYHLHYIKEEGKEMKPAHDSIKESYSKEEIFYYYPFHTSSVVIKKEILFSDVLRNAPMVMNGDTKLFLASTYIGVNHGINRLMSCYRASAGVTKNVLTTGIPRHITNTIVPLAKYYKIKGWKKHFLPRMILMSSYQLKNKNISMFSQTIFVCFKLSPFNTFIGIASVVSFLIKRFMLRFKC